MSNKSDTKDYVILGVVTFAWLGILFLVVDGAIRVLFFNGA